MDNIKRVILKLSGEALAKKEGGYNDELIENIANQVKTIVDKGTDVGVVIGGGNYWRGRSNDNIDRTKADQIRYACNNHELHICFRDIPFTGA